MTVSEVALSFLSTVPAEKQEHIQQEVNRFVIWYGQNQDIAKMTVHGVASYAESVMSSDADPQERLGPVRDFLAYAKRCGLTRTNLAPHLGTKRVVSKASKKSKREAKQENKPEQVAMTRETNARMQSELDSLKQERLIIAQEIRLAAADKDFRENAPLEAAKERQGHVEGKIRELETTLNAAIVLDEQTREGHRAKMNSTVVLCDLASGEELTYTLVGPREIAPLEGRISVLSPVGKAAMNHQEGETIVVSAPSGIHNYRIKRILSWRGEEKKDRHTR